MSEQSARPRPEQLGVFTRSRQLEVAWSDGHRSSYSWELLRWNCPCAVCAGEMGQPGVLQFVQKLSPEQITLIDLQEVGQYAVQPRWQDGHDTGFYSFDHLRRICPCPECRPNTPR